MANGDLTTLANVKQWLGLASAQDDALLMREITAVSSYIQTWLNRTIGSASYSEKRSGTGSQVMAFRHYPATAITSVTIDAVAIPAAADAVAPGYSFDDRFLFLNGYRFTKGRVNIAVVYSAGYAVTPPELEQAVIEVIALRYKERDRIGHVSKSLAGETVTFMIKDFPPSVQTILNSYRKVIPI